MDLTKNLVAAAYKAAIGDRDPAEVDILDILPTIQAAVPFATVDDIVAALMSSARDDLCEANALEAWARNRFEDWAP